MHSCACFEDVFLWLYGFCAFATFSILVFPPEVVLHVQHSCSRFEDGGCFHSLQFFHVFWSFPCLPGCIFSQKLYLRFSSACFFYVVSEVSFQLLWVYPKLFWWYVDQLVIEQQYGESPDNITAVQWKPGHIFYTWVWVIARESSSGITGRWKPEVVGWLRGCRWEPV